MKLLFHILLTYFFVYINSQFPDGKTVNGCGKSGYKEPQSLEDCKDDFEMCCFISLRNGTTHVKNFCFPAPKKIDKEDVGEEFKTHTGFDVFDLACNSERIKCLISHLILIGFILI